jgi:hypothetical protein
LPALLLGFAAILGEFPHFIANEIFESRQVNGPGASAAVRTFISRLGIGDQ